MLFPKRGCEGFIHLLLELAESDPGWAAVFFPELHGYNRSNIQNLDCIRTRLDGVFDFLTYDSLFPSMQESKDRVLISTDRLKSAMH